MVITFVIHGGILKNICGQEYFLLFILSKNSCNATDLAKNTRPKPTVWKVEDTNRVKNAVLSVRCSLNGRDFGALVADVC
jgi:hypothetical protein